MTRRFPIIYEKAVIAQSLRWGPPVGEALKRDDPQPMAPMLLEERQNMINRLEESIYILMNEAKATYTANNSRHNDLEHITRLSTNEFFFYTKEPLTLKEFEALQNKIAEQAKTMPAGVQLILGSFAVKTDEGRVMNVTPHITCGEPPDFNFIVKSNTSSIDVRYKVPDGSGGQDTLPVLDTHTRNSLAFLPTIMINGTIKNFTFDNIVRCKTPSGTPFLTAVDICLDHLYGVAKNNYQKLAKKEPSILKQPISHIIVSNSVNLDKTKCLGSAIMHVDTLESAKACKQGIAQKRNLPRKLAFGNDIVNIFDVAGEKIHLLVDYVKNNYAYKTTHSLAGRDHKSDTVSIDNVNYQKPKTSPAFAKFKDKYQAQKGDYLKTLILDDLKKRIENTTSKKELTNLKKELMHSYERDVLKTGQGWFTKTFGVKTSSEKVLENMFEQQERYLLDIGSKLSR